MQINGVGSGQVRDNYQRPNQTPNTVANKKETDEANKRLEALGVRVDISSQQKPMQESKPSQEKEAAKVQEEKFSLFEILKTLWEEGKKLVRAIWYSDSENAQEGGNAGEGVVQNAEALHSEKNEAQGVAVSPEIKVQEIGSEVQGPQMPDGTVHVKETGEILVEGKPSGDALEGGSADMQQVSGLDMAAIAAAAAAITPMLEQKSETVVPAAENDSRQAEGFWEKIRTKIKEIAEQLMGNMSEATEGFETQSSLQSREEQTKEEQPKQNESGMEPPELEGKPLHTSHLQDSYNKYGQYSKLAQDPQSSVVLRK